MKRPYKVQNGTNIPIQAPLYDSPFVPYSIPEMPTLSVYCKAAPGIIEKYLEPTPFEYTSSDFAVSISNMMNTEHSNGGFWDIAIVVPIKYKNKYGGYYLFEYEQDDYCVVAGRELWGYPKKMANGFLEEKDNKILGTATKNGVEILRLEMDLNKQVQGVIPPLVLTPHINLQVIPNCDGRVLLKRVISRDTTPDFVTKRKVQGFGLAKFKGILNNPLDEFTPVKVYGAVYTVGDYFATEENGWAKVLDVLYVDPSIKG